MNSVETLIIFIKVSLAAGPLAYPSSLPVVQDY
jgi:hypothetical protein